MVIMAELEFGIVSALDYQTCRIRVRLDSRDGVESYWLHVLQRNTQGTQRRPLMPELNEQVAVLLDEDGVDGVWLGGIYSRAEPPPVVDEDTDLVRFSDGTEVAYDRAAGKLQVLCVGAIDIQAVGPMRFKAPEVTLDTQLTTMKGDLQVDGNVNAAGTVMDAGGNSNHHSH